MVATPEVAHRTAPGWLRASAISSWKPRPAKAGVPTPKDVLGYHVGTEKKLTYVADQQKYFRALEKAFHDFLIVAQSARDELEHTAERACTVEGPLRAAKNLNPLDIGKVANLRC